MANLIMSVAIIFAMIGILIGAWRLIKGPHTVDRVVAMDALTIITIALIVFIAHVTNRFIYLDVALVYSLLSFLGVLGYARYLEGGL